MNYSCETFLREPEHSKIRGKFWDQLQQEKKLTEALEESKSLKIKKTIVVLNETPVEHQSKRDFISKRRTNFNNLKLFSYNST